LSEALINTSPSPRVLILGFDDVATLEEDLRKFAPTVSRIQSLEEVRQAEWDVLVTEEGLHGVEDSLCVVFIPPTDLAGITVDYRTSWDKQIEMSSGHISQELKRVSPLPERIRRLAHEELEPTFKSRQSHEYFCTTQSYQGLLSGNHKGSVPELEPFLLSGDDRVLAGRFRRSGCAEAWLLPSDTPNIHLWVKAAIAEWHQLDSKKFPGTPDWAEMPAWMTIAERCITSDIGVLEEEYEKATLRYQDQLTHLQNQFRTLSEEADSYQRALLTTQSDTLKDAVARAFKDLGFDVEDRDSSAGQGDDLEDLRLTDTSAPGWVCLVEVKGYSKGAATAAISQFIRFNSRYYLENKSLPSGNWYVVNQFLGRDPLERQPVLHGKDEDVQAFAEGNGGLVIDTVDLFRILDRVASGNLLPGDARASLRSSTGRYSATSP
jgi:hypothetical protein